MGARSEQVVELVRAAEPPVRNEILRRLRVEYPIHPIEARWNVSAEAILEAISNASDLTQRGIRGVIAEAVFVTTVLPRYPRFTPREVVGDHAYDAMFADDVGDVRIQVKLQRRASGEPMLWKPKRGQVSQAPHGVFVAETQRTRGGTDRETGKATRPYRFGEFDILAVCMQPSTGKWDRLMYTVASWLLPRIDNPELLDVYQPVSPKPDEFWTDDLAECVGWLRSALPKRLYWREA